MYPLYQETAKILDNSMSINLGKTDMEYQVQQQIKKFSFPLNVYAYVLAMESADSEVGYMHYGWFDHVADSMGVAQKRATDELLAWLPPSPARLLEVGSGVGTTLELLRGKGYDLLGITPDDAQISFMLNKYGKDFPVQQISFENIQIQNNNFDCILLQESGQYIPLKYLFLHSGMLLKLGGRLILCDEVLLGQPENGEYLHALTDLKSAAAEQGFKLIEMIDQTVRAAPMLKLMLVAVDKYRQELRHLLDVNDAQLDALNLSNEKYYKNYLSGKYGYVSMLFLKSS